MPGSEPSVPLIERAERRLTAILSADVAGYSRLMGANEDATLTALKAHRRELIDPMVAEYRGRTVKLTGDGALLEFPSVVAAVESAVAIQRAMADRNRDIPAEKRIVFRIGINVGDVIVEGDDIYGDGVNIAARLQEMAEPGGVCLSDDAYRQVRDRLALTYKDMGERQVKNISRPLRAYAVDLAVDSAAAPDPAVARELPLPDKPSIAVLPFVNMSGDAEQDYFSDGISEDLITVLSRLRWLFVIARNSSFVYKGRALDIKQISRELGVRYVVEGSVRRGGTRVRITVQLIDASTGAHIWGERYDRGLEDVFAVQDEITESVAGTIEPKLLAAEGVRSQGRRPADLDSWETLMRAMALFHRHTQEDATRAIAILKRLVESRPDYAQAHSMLALACARSGHMGWLPSEANFALAEIHARLAARLDKDDPWAHLALGQLATLQKRTETAVSEFNNALELNPNFAAARGFLGQALVFAGRGDEAIPHLERAMRHSPYDPYNAYFLGVTGLAHYFARRYEQAVAWGRRALQAAPGVFGSYRVLAAALAQYGDDDEARAVFATLKRMQPDISAAWMERTMSFARPELLAHYLEGLRKAGMTD